MNQIVQCWWAEDVISHLGPIIIIFDRLNGQILVETQGLNLWSMSVFNFIYTVFVEKELIFYLRTDIYRSIFNQISKEETLIISLFEYR